MITEELIKKLDTHDLYDVIHHTHIQFDIAGQLADIANFSRFERKLRKIVIAGMGGSAIGGDLARSLFANTDGARHLEITVSRDYLPTQNNDSDTLFIASSYSGGTEETISSVTEAFKTTKNIVAVSSGGYIEEFARKNSLPHIKLPEGFQPRCAIGLSFTVATKIILRLADLDPAIVGSIENDLFATAKSLGILGERYADLDESNTAIKLARTLIGKIPLIYSSGLLSSVNLRWRGQFQENAKCPAFGNVLPEMNHNEINGWEYPETMKGLFLPIFLSEETDHPRVKLRIEATRDVFEQNGFQTLTYSGAGTSFTERMFSLVALADWASYYLSLLYGANPADIKMISLLKEIMSGRK